MRTSREIELKNITERLESILDNDSSWVYDVKSFDFQTLKLKDSRIESILEYLKYNDGAYFKSYSVMSNRILINQRLYSF